VGPFPAQAGSSATGLSIDFLSELGGEERIQPVEGMSHWRENGSSVKWHPFISWGDAVFLDDALEKPCEDAVAYAFATVRRREGGKALLSFGSDEGSRVWINGKMVLDHQGRRSLTLDEDRVLIDLEAGENSILVKVVQHVGPWNFAVRMLEPGSALPRPGEIGPSLIRDTEGGLEVKTDIGQERPDLEQVRVELVGPGGKEWFSESAPRGGRIVINADDLPDGPYEVRCATRELISGKLFVTHLPWYKGSLRAKTKRLINAARHADESRPEGFTLRMLANMVLDRLGGPPEKTNGNPWWRIHSPLMEFEELMLESNGQTGRIRPHGFVRLAYRDPTDGSPQFCRAYLPAGYDPLKKWPMVVYLHGYHAPNPEYFRWWQADMRHPDIDTEFTDGERVIYIEPHGRGNTSFQGIGEMDILKAIELARRTFSVDDDRIYLTGESMGGWGTWSIGSRYPGIFAAIAPIFGGSDYHSQLREEQLATLSPIDRFQRERLSSLSMAESLLNLPIWVWHGDVDTAVPVEWSQYLVKALQQWGYDIRYSEVPGRGHEALGQMNRVIEWFLQHRRKPNPHHVRVRSADLRHASAYWIRVERRESPLKFMLVDAEVVGPNLIRLDSRNVLRVTLSPLVDLVNPDKPVDIVWNGVKKRVDLANGQITLTSEAYQPGRLNKSPTLPGSQADFITTPFAIVVGTISQDQRMVDACREQGESAIKFWKRWQNQPPRIFKDTELSPEDAAAHSLLLIGGPEANQVTAQIISQIPLRIEGDEISIDGTPFHAPGAAVKLIYPSPLNPLRYILVTAATSAESMSFTDPLNGQQEIWDFMVFDSGTLPLDEKIPHSNRALVKGIFDSCWRIDSAYLVE